MFTIFRTPIGTTLPSSFQNFGPSQHANTRASSTASDTKQWRPFTKESLAELQLLPSFSGITLGSHPTSGVTTAISFPKASFLLPFVEQSCFFLKFGPNIFRNVCFERSKTEIKSIQNQQERRKVNAVYAVENSVVITLRLNGSPTMRENSIIKLLRIKKCIQSFLSGFIFSSR